MSDTRAAGADVSHYHTVKDWAALAASVSFLGVKATQGLTAIDPALIAHRDGFRASTIPLGVYYHFAVPGDPLAQARHLASTVGVLQPNERLCLDLEVVPVPGGNSFAWVDAFFTELMAGACGGKRPLIYTSARIWKQIGDPLWDLASEIDLWAPRYGAAEPELPRGWDRWTIWQNSETAVVPGIDGQCDGDLWNGTDADVRAYAGVAGKPALVA